MALETKKQHRATVRELAAKAFAQHVITDLGAAGDVRTFRCAGPGTGIYSFRVVVWPGWLVVAGDIGDTIFSHSDRDSLGWLRGAKNSLDYMLGKVCNPHKRWMPGDAARFVNELATHYGEFADDQRPKLGDRYHALPKREECDSDDEFAAHMRSAQEDVDADNRNFDAEAQQYRLRAQIIRDACGDEFDDACTFYEACRDQDVDEPPECRDFESDHLWAVEALRWFIDALDAQPEPYLIRCIDQAGQQEMALWWRPERRGYTTSIAEAGRYTREEAEAQARARDIDFAVPLSKALALSSPTVRAEKFTELAKATATP